MVPSQCVALAFVLFAGLVVARPEVEKDATVVKYESDNIGVDGYHYR